MKNNLYFWDMLHFSTQERHREVQKLKELK